MQQNEKELKTIMEIGTEGHHRAQWRMGIVENIRKIIKQKGLSEKEVKAALSELSGKDASRKNANETSGYIGHLEQMAAVLGVPLYEIVTPYQTMTPAAMQKLAEYRELAEQWQRFACNRCRIPFVAQNDNEILEHALDDGIAAMRELLRINGLEGVAENGE